MPDPSFKSSVLVLVLVSACTASHGVPAALDAVESRAEDTFDNALAGDFTAAADNVVQLRAEWTSYRSRAVGDGATPTTLEAVVSL